MKKLPGSKFDSPFQGIINSRKKIKDSQDKRGQINSVLQGYELLLLDRDKNSQALRAYLERKNITVSNKVNGLHLAIAKYCLGKKCGKNQWTKYGQALFAAAQGKWPKAQLRSNLTHGLDSTAACGSETLKNANPEFYDEGIEWLEGQALHGVLVLEKTLKKKGWCMLIGYIGKQKKEVEIRYISTSPKIKKEIAQLGKARKGKRS